MSSEVSHRSDRTSYGQILKSSALVGGAQALVAAIGVVRLKLLAVLLGPAGFGIMGLYLAILDLAASAAGLGVGSSGVRQIAEAVGSGNQRQISVTVAALRRASLALGIVGAALLLLASSGVSQLTFGDRDHTWGVALISVAVLFRVVAAGQSALIQGLRRIGDLAGMNVLGAAIGAAATVLLVYFLGERGLAASVVAGAFFTLLISWWFARRVKTERVEPVAGERREQIRQLLRLGIAFLASALMMMGTMYVVRMMITRQLGLSEAGLYQAAWTLGGMYIGMLLQAMGADFYPRLTAVHGDHARCNQLVNEQARVSLLLAGPGMLATLTFAAPLMVLFYSDEFASGARLLQWICLGMTLRVISWPMGFIIVAKGARNLFIATELAWTVVNVGLTWICLRNFGLAGAGIAFFGSYVFHALMIYPIVRRLSGFGFSAENLLLIAGFLVVAAAVFAGFFFLSQAAAVLIGAAAMAISSVYCLRRVARLVPLDEVPRMMRWPLALMGGSTRNQ